MALKNRDNSLKFLRIKEGLFYVGKDLETPYEELEGQIVGLRYKNEEYEGIPQRKLIITLADGEDHYQLGLNVEHSNYSSFVSFLANVDVTKSLTLHPKSEKLNKDGKDVTRNALLVSQNGTFAKSYFTKDNKHGLPEWNIVKVGSKKVTDKSEYTDFLEKFVMEKFASKLEQPLSKTEVSRQTIDDTDELEPVEKNKTQLPWD